MVKHDLTTEEIIVAEKLRLLKSPLIHDGESLPPSDVTAPDLQLFGDRFEPDNECPQFQKHEDASLLELFYDLFFAANYTVFSETQSVNSHDRFKAYVGYFSVLWVTWLMTTLYDVRFVTDSMFERAARGVHLGVMVGFAVVAPHFKPSDQNAQTMRTMSLILMTSRLCLAVEYGSIFWHIRKYKKQRLPMMIQIGTNFVAAMIYMGIAFRFTEGNSSVFITWYVLAGFEIFITMTLGNIWPVLSFVKTHLMKRLNLLTIIILGDGIIVVAKNVVIIVESPHAWNSQTIGIVTAATITIYAVFLIYFDWMKHPYLPAVRQQMWTFLHYPFHLALVLFMQGFTQFIIWSKIINTIKNLTFDNVLNNIDDVARATTKQIIDSLTKTIEDFFKLYPPKYTLTSESVITALNNISTIPDAYWPELIKYSRTNATEDMPPMNETNIFVNAFQAISVSMENALLETFGIDLVKELSEENETATADTTGFEVKVNQETWERFDLVFSYAYIAAGATLILMTILTIVSRLTPWKRWSIIRTIIFILLGLGTGLVSVLYYTPKEGAEFQDSPLLLPTICIVYVVVLFLTHVRNPPPMFFASSGFFSKTRTQAYNPVEVPLTNAATEYKGASNLQSQERQTSYYGHTPQHQPGYGGYGQGDVEEAYPMTQHAR
ncbi:hypothetical protein G7046_g4234 [Stylonectria norvegica]|nr:hypothetical protein G7046_g4234 [Stylonectria norvegica]